MLKQLKEDIKAVFARDPAARCRAAGPRLAVRAARAGLGHRGGQRHPSLAGRTGGTSSGGGSPAHVLLWPAEGAPGRGLAQGPGLFPGRARGKLVL